MKILSATLLILSALAALTACTQHVVLDDRFPTPVMKPVPAAVTLYLPPELKSHTHVHKPERGVEWNIEFREANAKLFASTLSGLFQPLTVVAELKGVPEDATIVKPVMVDYQFSTPGQSKTDYFEVWIKYKLQLYHPKGILLHEWPFTAYGREEDSGNTKATAMKEATRRAMRDAAAAVVVGYMKAPVVKNHFVSEAAEEAE